MNKHGQLCYTYYLYHIPTGKKYYGSRYANKLSPEQDLWNVYFGSSDLVDEFVEAHGKDSFVAEVRKTFETKEDALIWEDRVLRKLDAPKRDDWLNQSYSLGPHRPVAPFGGRTHKQESKDKIAVSVSKAKIGKKRPAFDAEWKKNMSDSRKKYLAEHPHPSQGISRTVEQKEHLRDMNLGDKNPFYKRTHKEESKQKMRDTKRKNKLRKELLIALGIFG